MASDDLINQRLGQYEIAAVLGRGGMATVYLARQTSMDRDVAIKVMARELADDEQFIARFQHEAQVIARLQHPHILPVIDFGREGKNIYIVMRLVRGGSLDDRLKSGPLDLPLASRMLAQIASALTFAHEQGIIHRDLKPNNVLLDERDNAYLTDFGIAKMLAGTSKLTATGNILGTPAYMAPEQWRGEGVDARTDT
ncbi:MAG: serine/threonine protein kinase, partial [Roseovarius sp.]|nr:serine/threonine protein kinase [Roseovarius sp.]